MATDRPILRLGKQDEGRLVSSEEFAEADFAGALEVRARGREADRHGPSRRRAFRDHRRLARLVGSVSTRPTPRSFKASSRKPGFGRRDDRVGDIGVYLMAEDPVPRVVPTGSPT